MFLFPLGKNTPYETGCSFIPLRVLFQAGSAGLVKRHSITFKGEPCSAPTDKVQAEGILLDGEPVEFPGRAWYAALYKPAGIYVQP